MCVAENCAPKEGAGWELAQDTQQGGHCILWLWLSCLAVPAIARWWWKMETGFAWGTEGGRTRENREKRSCFDVTVVRHTCLCIPVPPLRAPTCLAVEGSWCGWKRQRTHSAAPGKQLLQELCGSLWLSSAGFWEQLQYLNSLMFYVSRQLWRLHSTPRRASRVFLLKTIKGESGLQAASTWVFFVS